MSTPTPDGRPGRVRWLAIFAAALVALYAYYLLIWPDLGAFSKAIDWAPRPFEDFRTHYLPMAEKILADPVSTDGYFYPAFLAIALHPITLFGPQFALRFWVLLTGAAALLGWWAGCRLLRLRHPAAQLVLLLLSLSTHAVLHTFNWGQVSILLTTLTLCSIWLARSGHPRWAGVVIGVAIAIKIYPAIFLWFFLAKKGRQAIIAAGITAFTLVCLLPGTLLGFGRWLTFEITTQRNLAATVWIGDDGLPDKNSQAFAHVFGRWLPRLVDQTSDQALAAAAMLGYLLGALLLGLAFWIIRRGRGDSDLLGLALIFAATPFLSRVAWPHYFTYLPFLQMLVFVEVRRRTDTSVAGAIRPSVPIISMLVSNIAFFNLFDRSRDYVASSMPFLANLILIPLLIAAGLRRSVTERPGSTPHAAPGALQSIPAPMDLAGADRDQDRSDITQPGA